MFIQKMVQQQAELKKLGLGNEYRGYLDMDEIQDPGVNITAPFIYEPSNVASDCSVVLTF